MNVWGTDVMALACILGSAAVSGAATMAAFDGGDDSASVCVSGVSHGDAAVVMSLGEGAQTIVVRPRVRIHAAQGCEPLVVDVGEATTIRLDEVRARVERARARSERARARAEEVRARAEEARARVDAGLDGELEARLQREMERLEKELARLDGVVVR